MTLIEREVSVDFYWGFFLFVLLCVVVFFFCLFFFCFWGGGIFGGGVFFHLVISCFCLRGGMLLFVCLVCWIYIHKSPWVFIVVFFSLSTHPYLYVCVSPGLRPPPGSAGYSQGADCSQVSPMLMMGSVGGGEGMLGPEAFENIGRMRNR